MLVILDWPLASGIVAEYYCYNIEYVVILQMAYHKEIKNKLS